VVVGQTIPRVPARAAERGFSLAELLVALAVSLMVVGGATMLAAQMQGAYRAQMEGAAVQQDARYAIEQVERYLRAAGNNPYRLLTTPCPATGTPFMAIRLDPNGNGISDDIRLQMDANPANGLVGGSAGGCNEGGEDVTIFYDAANRQIAISDANTGGAPRALTDAVVTGLQFLCRTTAGATTTTAAHVAFVETRVTVQTRSNALTQGRPLIYTLSSEVRVRSR
jgi:prepilin-type N-terminal cleavage/methylation domain-containing protein